MLDELAQATASTICINESTDELEIRYINNTNDSTISYYTKAEEESNICLIQSQISRLDALRNRLSGRDD